MTEREGEPIQGTGTALRRRGLIAGAAALVAGMVAKQATQPVAANADHQPLIIGEPNTEGTAGTSLAWTGGSFVNGGAALQVTDGGTPTSYSAVIGGIATADNAAIGVYGESHSGVGTVGLSVNKYGVNGFSTNSYGVRGKSTNNTGVYGESTISNGVVGFSSGASGVYGEISAPAGSGFAGVRGSGNGAGNHGVLGDNTGAGYGVYGRNDYAGGTGVRGDSYGGFPIVGNVTYTGNNAAGVLGAGTVGPGVQGQSLAGHGLVGTTGATDGHAGLIGNASAAGGIGLMGIAPGYGTASVGKAGEFFGNLAVHGAVTAPSVQAVVPHAGDNTYRVMHAVTAPEGWSEDFGKGALAGGHAEIKLDPDFAALIRSDDYLIYLTPYGPQHLHVEQHGPGGFTVVGTALAPTGGGLPRPEVLAGTFAWRVVAKRKDVAAGRLAKVAGPPAPKAVAPLAVPESPPAALPPKQP